VPPPRRCSRVGISTCSLRALACQRCAQVPTPHPRSGWRILYRRRYARFLAKWSLSADAAAMGSGGRRWKPLPRT